MCMKSNASSKTWTPLPDCFIDNHLVEMFPLFDQARLQLVDVTAQSRFAETRFVETLTLTLNPNPNP